jgi:glycosyltransferase involved in cell wall biosynthesis
MVGIGRYVHELSLALESLGVPLTYFARGRWSQHLPSTNSAVLPSALRSWIPSLPGARWLDRQRLNRLFLSGASSLKARLYHEPGFLAFDFDGPVVITAHDASWVRYPEAHPGSRVKLMGRLFPKSLERAQLVIVDSDFVAREMMEIFGVAQSRLRTIHLGVGAQFRPRGEGETRAVCERFQLQRGEFILAVGTLEPRKNLATLIDAYSVLPQAVTDRCPLVIAGRPGWQHRDIDQRMAALERAGKLRVLGHVAEHDLPALYASCAMFIYPSVYEGFGLPPLEAMASGAPVIVADRASLPEVVGDAGLLVEPHDVSALASHIQSLMGDPERRKRMGQAGLEQASRFTWRQCAVKTRDVYRELLNS